MTISGSLPPAARALSRAAQAYGVTPKVATPAERAPAAGAERAAAPEGLRAVLSDEERAYFDQIASLGPITYGPGRTGGMTPDAPRGLRLDVRG